MLTQTTVNWSLIPQILHFSCWTLLGCLLNALIASNSEGSTAWWNSKWSLNMMKVTDSLWHHLWRVVFMEAFSTIAHKLTCLTLPLLSLEEDKVVSLFKSSVNAITEWLTRFRSCSLSLRFSINSAMQCKYFSKSISDHSVSKHYNIQS